MLIYIECAPDCLCLYDLFTCLYVYLSIYIYNGLNHVSPNPQYDIFGDRVFREVTKLNEVIKLWP